MSDHFGAVLSASALVVGAVKGTPYLAWLPIDLTLLCCALLALGLLAHILKQGSSLRVVPGVVVLVAVLVPPAFTGCPLGYRVEKVEGIVITLLMVLASACLVTSEPRRTLWVRYLALAGMLTAIALTVLPTDPSQYGRAVLEGSNTIAAGRQSGMAVVVLAAVALSPVRFLYRALGVGLALFAGVAMIATGSRGPLLAVVLVLVLLALRSERGGRAVRLVLTSALLAAGWFFLSTDQSAGSERIEESLTGDASGTATRQPLWDAALRYLGDPASSVSGTGWGGFVQVMRSGELLPTGLVQYPHNVFLEVFVEGGWVTGGVITAIIFLSVFRLWRLARDSSWLPVLAIGAFALVNACVSGDINDNRMLWVALALAWTVPHPSSRSKGAPPRANRLPTPVLQNATAERGRAFVSLR